MKSEKITFALMLSLKQKVKGVLSQTQNSKCKPTMLLSCLFSIEYFIDCSHESINVFCYIKMSVKENVSFSGGLGIGLTTINPAEFDVETLPDNADLMKVAPGKYWQISRDLDTKEGK